jgi:predicted phage terminase large subunit-like protein
LPSHSPLRSLEGIQREIQRADRSLSRASLSEFVRLAWPQSQGDPLLWNWHIPMVCECLEAVFKKQIQKLVINIPPGHAKSYLTAVYFPAWCWLQDPRWQGIFASYASDLAERDSIRTRDLIEHPWYQGLLDPVDGQVPWVLKRDSNRKDLFTNTLGGFRIALGVTGMGTGWRGDCIVVDDPIKATDAKSKAKLDYVIHWYYQQMSSRLKDPRTGQRITIMQRLNSKDLTGEIKNRGDHEMLVLPSEYEPKHKTRVFIYPIDAKTKVRSSKPKLLCQDPRENEGELLFPQFFTPEVLQQAKKDLGSEGYAGQHQQRPVPAGGNIFKYKWFRFYRPDGSDSYGDSPRPDSCNNMPARIIPDKFDRILISLDAAFKDQPENDYVAFHVWGGLKADRFLLDRVKEHLSFTDTLATFKRLCKKWPLAFRKIVEDKANGSAVINTLQSEISGIISIEPEGGKEARAFAVQPQVESGNVYLPEGVDWLGEFLEEVCTFPKASHDDDVDAMTQALLDMLVSGGQRETEALGDLS